MDEKQKILIVDDEQINLDFFDVMLSKLGFHIERAQDGEEALDMVAATNPDLIILDNIMPKLSGWEVTKILKTGEDYKKYRDIPIIMFSAMDDVKDKIEGYELGVEDYITKPFNFSEVLARIRAVLRNHDLSLQVVKRERRIALIESLNKSLVYFTEYLKQPVLDLIKEARGLNVEDPDGVRKFVDVVITEAEKTIAALNALDEEVRDLKLKGDRMKEDEIPLEDLASKFQKNFKNLKSREGRVKGASH